MVISVVFVGNVSAMVRDKLWELVCQRIRSAKQARGGAMLIWNTNNEQGYAARSFGVTNRKIVDMDGLTLMLKASPTAFVEAATEAVDETI